MLAIIFELVQRQKEREGGNVKQDLRAPLHTPPKNDRCPEEDKNGPLHPSGVESFRLWAPQSQ